MTLQWSHVSSEKQLRKVAEAEHASEALLEATKANAKTFEEYAA